MSNTVVISRGVVESVMQCLTWTINRSPTQIVMVDNVAIYICPHCGGEGTRPQNIEHDKSFCAYFVYDSLSRAVANAKETNQ